MLCLDDNLKILGQFAKVISYLNERFIFLTIITGGSDRALSKHYSCLNNEELLSALSM